MEKSLYTIAVLLSPTPDREVIYNIKKRLETREGECIFDKIEEAEEYINTIKASKKERQIIGRLKEDIIETSIMLLEAEEFLTEGNNVVFDFGKGLIDSIKDLHNTVSNIAYSVGYLGGKINNTVAAKNKKEKESIVQAVKEAYVYIKEKYGATFANALFGAITIMVVSTFLRSVSFLYETNAQIIAYVKSMVYMIYNNIKNFIKRKTTKQRPNKMLPMMLKRGAAKINKKVLKSLNMLLLDKNIDKKTKKQIEKLIKEIHKKEKLLKKKLSTKNININFSNLESKDKHLKEEENFDTFLEEDQPAQLSVEKYVSYFGSTDQLKLALAKIKMYLDEKIGNKNKFDKRGMVEVLNNKTLFNLTGLNGITIPNDKRSINYVKILVDNVVITLGLNSIVDMDPKVKSLLYNISLKYLPEYAKLGDYLGRTRLAIFNILMQLMYNLVFLIKRNEKKAYDVFMKMNNICKEECKDELKPQILLLFYMGLKIYEITLKRYPNMSGFLKSFEIVLGLFTRYL